MSFELRVSVRHVCRSAACTHNAHMHVSVCTHTYIYIYIYIVDSAARKRNEHAQRAQRTHNAHVHVHTSLNSRASELQFIDPDDTAETKGLEDGDIVSVLPWVHISGSGRIKSTE